MKKQDTLAMNTLVWHFSLQAMPGSALPVAGQRLHTIDNPVADGRGWGGSIYPLDALNYARLVYTGCHVAIRELSGTLRSNGIQYFASDCTMVTGYVDVRDVLVRFARYCALDALRVQASIMLRLLPSLTAHADRLASLTDDCDLRKASNAAHNAWTDVAHAANVVGYGGSESVQWAAVNASHAADAADAASDATNSQTDVIRNVVSAAEMASNTASIADSYARHDVPHYGYKCSSPTSDAQNKWLDTELRAALARKAK